jgi:hypothetical protein
VSPLWAIRDWDRDHADGTPRADGDAADGAGG